MRGALGPCCACRNNYQEQCPRTDGQVSRKYGYRSDGTHTCHEGLCVCDAIPMNNDELKPIFSHRGICRSYYLRYLSLRQSKANSHWSFLLWTKSEFLAASVAD